MKHINISEAEVKLIRDEVRARGGSDLEVYELVKTRVLARNGNRLVYWPWLIAFVRICGVFI